MCIILFASMFVISGETIMLTNGEWPPFLSEQLPHYGYWSHLATEAFALEGITVEYGFFPWKRAFAVVKDGDWDGSAFWAKSPEREKSVIFSNTPIDTLRQMIYYHKDTNFDWKTIDDVEGLMIGTLHGTTHQEKLEKAQLDGKNIQFESVQNEFQNIKKLLVGRIDIFIGNETVCDKYLHDQFSSAERSVIIKHPIPWSKTPFYLIVNKQNEKTEFWLESFERGLKKLKDTGRYNQIKLDFLKGLYDENEIN